jgi:branched-chain amino acid aminotransferase
MSTAMEIARRAAGWSTNVVYDGTRTYRGMPFELRGHVQRFLSALDEMGMEVEWTESDLVEQALVLLSDRKRAEHDHATDWSIRFMAARSEDETRLDRALADVHCGPLHPLTKRLAPLYERGAALVYVEQPSIPESLLRPQIKSRGSSHFRLAELQADRHARGSFALLRNVRGEITEGVGRSASGWNFFLVRDGQLHTPPVQDIVNGFGRRSALRLAKQLNMECVQRFMVPEDVADADEAFITSSLIGVMPVGSIEGRRLPSVNGPVTTAIARAFHAAVDETCPADSPPHDMLVQST